MGQHFHRAEAKLGIAGRFKDQVGLAHLLDQIGKLPGLEAGLKLTQRDERRHIAYGTYLSRRVLAEHPELWEWLEQRWAKLTAGFGDGYGTAGAGGQDEPGAAELTEQYELYRRLSKRRLDALAVARTMNVAQVDASAVETFEPVELQHVS